MAGDDVVVITGGAGAMGLACAKALTARARLLLLDDAEEPLDHAAQALIAAGATLVARRCDVSSPSDVSAIPDLAASMGRFRALVHTAGVSPAMAEPRRVLEVDLIGPARVTNTLFPLAGPGSSAILIGSIAGYSEVKPSVEALLDDPLAEGFLAAVEQALDGPLDSATAYVLAKKGVMRLAERLAISWGRRGGRTVTVSPGLIDTPMGRLELASQPIVPAMAEVTPVQRPGQRLPGRPEDIASAVAFLISDEAAFISGCDIRVDGGLVGAGKHMLSAGSVTSPEAPR
jgi:NAD(P)-dependent dehydrogenase (short-subunit alcohol dehydrogenase family)